MVWDVPEYVIFLAPFLFAVTVIIDVFLVRQSVYKKPMDGVIVSILIGGVTSTALAFSLGGRINPLDFSAGALLASFGSVIFFVGHLWTYFKVMFVPDQDGQPTGDGTIVEILINFNVVTIPLAAMFLFGDVLSVWQWGGITLILAGALLCGGNTQFSKKTLMYGLASATSVGCMAICQEYVYQEVTFEQGLMAFSQILLVVSICALLWSPLSEGVVTKSNIIYFSFSEVIGILAFIASQRAIDLNPVWLVATVEGLVPLFILGIAFLLMICTHIIKSFSNRRLFSELWKGAAKQWEDPYRRVASLMSMLVGITLVLHEEPEQMIALLIG